MISFDVNALFLNSLLRIWVMFRGVPKIEPTRVVYVLKNLRRKWLASHQTKKSWGEAIVCGDGLNRR